jgi:hypothetical protein
LNSRILGLLDLSISYAESARKWKNQICNRASHPKSKKSSNNQALTISASKQPHPNPAAPQKLKQNFKTE